MIALILQVSGLLIMSLGLGLVYTPLGFIGLGVSSVLIGLSIERSI